MVLDVATMMMMIVLASSVMALAVSVVAWDRTGDGMRLLAALLVFQSLAYLALALRGRVDDLASVVLGNMLIAATQATLFQAVCWFHGIAVKPALAWSPVLFVAVVFLWLIDDYPARVLAAGIIFPLQSLPIIGVLFFRRRSHTGRGQYLVLMAIMLNVCTLLPRTVLAALGTLKETHLLAPTGFQVTTFLGSFSATVLVAIGFTLMVYERMEATSQALALRDPLTGARNRRYYDEVVPGELDRSRRYGHAVSAMMIDIDHFKNINDGFGHGTGDQVLSALVERIGSVLRTSDSLIRWGGEEFVVILPETDQAGAVVLAERIRRHVGGTPFARIGRVTVSIGVAEFRPLETAPAWIDRADAAMYRAKGLGRDRVEIEEPVVGVGTADISVAGPESGF